MSRAEEVYDGIRCAVCEHRFAPGDRVALNAATSERVHYDAPDDCPSGDPE